MSELFEISIVHSPRLVSSDRMFTICLDVLYFSTAHIPGRLEISIRQAVLVADDVDEGAFERTLVCNKNRNVRMAPNFCIYDVCAALFW